MNLTSRAADGAIRLGGVIRREAVPVLQGPRAAEQRHQIQFVTGNRQRRRRSKSGGSKSNRSLRGRQINQIAGRGSPKPMLPIYPRTANGRILIPDAIRPPAKSIDADQPQAPDW